MEIAIKNFQHKISINPKDIKKLILNILTLEHAKGYREITACFVTDSQIQRLNKTYSQKNAATDVLAFVMDVAGYNVGDIIISTDTAARNALAYKTSQENETRLYLIHGLLHLLGYRDHTLRQKELMRKKEKQYLWLYKKQMR